MSSAELGARTLVLLRHGKSDWSGGHGDRERPLAERGRRQAPEAGRWLEANVGPIDLVLVSPAERAVSTWNLVADQLSRPGSVRTEDRVYDASAAELLAMVRELPDDARTVLLVGHNPGLEDLVHRLLGQEVPMKTSGIAVVEVQGSWTDLGQAPATLHASGRPPKSA